MTSINSNRKSLVCGVGINDADYPVTKKINGKTLSCPFYKKWLSMIQRCYSPSVHIRQPTYTKCSVAEEWQSFMTFREWMKRQDWRGNALDKDILIKSNKVYSPETCLFIPCSINNLMNGNDANRGKYAQGVYWNKNHRKFKAQIKTCKINSKFLGYFNTENEAGLAYKKAKSDYIRAIAFQQSDYRIAKALLNQTP